MVVPAGVCIVNQNIKQKSDYTMTVKIINLLGSSENDLFKGSANPLGIYWILMFLLFWRRNAWTLNILIPDNHYSFDKSLA